MIRTLSAERFNIMIGHPEVRPWVGGTHDIDLTETVANPENFAFLTDEGWGGYIYHKLDVGLYAVHTLSLPSGRTREMLEARSASLREMFIKSDAVRIVTVVPDGNKGADLWAQRAGFRELFRRIKSFDLMGEMVDASYRALTYDEWVTKDAGNLSDGRAFHRMIHEVTPDDHGDDPVHDAWCGATIEGCAAGNAEKALTCYNRWALHAGYQPVRVLTAHPLVLDIGTALLQSDPDGLRVLYVRPFARSAPHVEDLSGEPSCQSSPSAQPQA